MYLAIRAVRKHSRSKVADMAKNRAVSRTRFIKASPEAIFEVVSNSAKHSLIDGSGSVMSAREGTPTQLVMGTEFGMNMKIGVPYKMQNTVVSPAKAIFFQ